MKTVAYVGNFGFPNRNASGKRVFGNCKLLQEIGYRVICIGPGKEKKATYAGIDLFSIDRGNELQRVLHSKLNEVKAIILEKQIEVIILYGALFTERENFQLIKWCKKNRISVIYDQVDWLDLNWTNPLRGLIRAKNHYLMNKKVIPACDGVICISSFLSEYHSSRGKKTVIIPPLSVEQCEDIPEKYSADTIRPVQLVYAGTTSDVNRPTSQWKDRIDIMLERLLECKKHSSIRSFVLNIYGMTEDQYVNMFPINERENGRKVVKELGDGVVFNGSLPNDEVMRRIKAADFTVLIRDRKRATMSGFPTKVSESISCGTPILCNDTSDINEYIQVGKMGYIMDDVTMLYEKALSLSDNEIRMMKQACKNNPFYYSLFVEEMKRIVEGSCRQ